MGDTQLPIMTATLNPALDISTGVDAVRPEIKLRCAPPRYDPGGGGINISRAIATLGGHTTAFVALGGAIGEQLAELLAAQGIVLSRLQSPGETRLSFSVTDQASSEQYRFVLPGPIWSQTQVSTALQAIVSAAPKTGYIVYSGSQPPGFPDDFIAQLSAALPQTARLVADTSGGPLMAVAHTGHAKLDVLRMDGEEADAVAKTALTHRQDSADFAQTLARRGVAKRVVIARGAEGSVMATPTERWFCAAAKVPVVSKIGAGDSFVAGFVLALAQGKTDAEALVHGVAAASAAVMTPATALCRAEDVVALLGQCPATPC
ncbi:1-phosphofructokinase family hexose kinase [Pseudorhodobacter sp. W20_MBD10_FR17]|uniref:1-phosphofructokinase family hexose kinase n=1 Tax=Pseudorhodobacter sp. W20_MBD10_FR17 TaxID=3240266 RepID=UPI003F9E713F